VQLSAGRTAIKWYLLPAKPTAAHLQQWVFSCGPTLRLTDGRTNKQTYGQTPYHYIDLAPHTTRAVPTQTLQVNSSSPCHQRQSESREARRHSVASWVDAVGGGGGALRRCGAVQPMTFPQSATGIRSQTKTWMLWLIHPWRTSPPPGQFHHNNSISKKFHQAGTKPLSCCIATHSLRRSQFFGGGGASPGPLQSIGNISHVVNI